MSCEVHLVVRYQFSLDEGHDQHDDQQHDGHGRRQPDLAEDKGALDGLDDERCAAVRAPGHDEGDLEYGETSGDREDERETDDALDSRQDDEPELLEPVRAVEIGAQAILKATKVDGIYSADPKKDPTATRFTKLEYFEVLTRGLEVMDNTALTLCMDNDVPIIVFDMNVAGNIRRVVFGEEIGTLVSTPARIGAAGETVAR